MQSKALIKTITCCLIIACLYHLSFTLVSFKVNKDAERFAQGDQSKKTEYINSIQNQVVYNIGIAKYTYKEVKEKEINLGLDLKGGMSITMVVSMEDLLYSLANDKNDKDLIKAVRLAQERANGSIKNFVDIFAEAYEAIAPNRKLAGLFANNNNLTDISSSSSNKDVLAYLHVEVDAAIDRTFNILRTRIDKFGVAQPNLQKAGNGKILIELPGVTDEDRVRKLLKGTAKLEFWETYDNKDIFPILTQINSMLAEVLPQDSLENVSLNKPATSKKSDLIKVQEAQAAQMENNPLFSVLNPSISLQPSTYAMPIPGPVVGYASHKDIAKINCYLHDQAGQSYIPYNLKFAWSAKPIDEKNGIYTLYALKGTGVDNAAVLDGEYIVNARSGINQLTGESEVVMFMNSEGADIWKNITAKAVKNNSSIAIVLDNFVYSAPKVNSEIPNGVSTISGTFTINEATDLATILKAGKLPAPVHIQEEAVIGPALGQEAINAGLIACLIGLIAVFVFVWIYYNTAGLVANLALVFNLFLIIGILSSFQAVLTLPGIAGIILTLGMAVDANVIIYERIKEELLLTKSLKAAINNGFRHAYSAIIDANVTTLLLGIVLYIFSSGIVKGFATTLIIGIFTSMFTAIYITRLVLDLVIKNGRSISFSTKLTKSLFKHSNFDFVKKRKFFYTISLSVIILGVISLYFRGLNTGVDFKGGRSYVVRFDSKINAESLRKELTPLFGKEAPEIKTFGTDNQFKITTSYLIANQTEDADIDVRNILEQGLAKLPAKGSILSTQKEGPTIAKDLKIAAYYSILISLIVMYAYILLRFKRWQFSLGAVLALIHDVLIIISIYSIFNGILPFSLDVNQTFVAALLTVMGYSMNDTVVIFDRMRETYNKHFRTRPIQSIVNVSLNGTLSRTIVTAWTTALVLLVILIFGGETLASFSFAMLVGVIVGTYSSLFIANVGILDFSRNSYKALQKAEPFNS